VSGLWLLLVAALIAATAGAATAGSVRADVSQTPVATGCPAGSELLSVASLEATGPYTTPRLVDTAGNNNGLVCGAVVPDALRAVSCKLGSTGACTLGELGLPAYHFIDDDNPAKQQA
jgi:hypothetical protein